MTALARRLRRVDLDQVAAAAANIARVATVAVDVLAYTRQRWAQGAREHAAPAVHN